MSYGGSPGSLTHAPGQSLDLDSVAWARILAALLRYCLSAATVGIGLFVSTRLLTVSDRANLFLLLLAVVVSTYYGGLRSGLLAIVLASAGAAYFLLHPLNALAIHNLDDLLRWIFFVGTSFVIVLLIWRQQKAHQIAKRLTRAVPRSRAGADGYVGKKAQASEVSRAVETVGGGQKSRRETGGQNLTMGVDTGMSSLPHETLSNREDQVFRLLITGKSMTAIATELELSVTTVSTYRARILKKLNLINNAELICYAMKRGLLD